MLTDAKLRKIKPTDKTKRHYDEGGMYLEVTPAGGMYWRMKYRKEGKEQRAAFGTYPAVSLASARQKRDETRALLAAGTDPQEAKKASKLKVAEDQALFFMVAEQWLSMRDADKKNNDENRRRLNADVIPFIGHMPIAEITEEVLEKRVFAPLLERDVRELAKRVRSDLRGVFTLARKKKLISTDPLQDIILPTPEKGHFAALTEPEDVKRLIFSLWRPDQRAAPSVVNAAQLGILLFLRPSELRFLKWSEVNLIGDERGPLISIFSKKKKKDLLIPLCRQAIEILNRQKDHSAHSPYIFPAQRPNTKDPVLSEGTIRGHLIAHGFAGEQTHHGMRATAKTLLVERLGADDRYIEMQLTHTVKDHLGAAYNRAKFLADRREMMNTWGDYLDELRDGKIIQFPKASA